MPSDTESSIPKMPKLTLIPTRCGRRHRGRGQRKEEGRAAEVSHRKKASGAEHGARSCFTYCFCMVAIWDVPPYTKSPYSGL